MQALGEALAAKEVALVAAESQRQQLEQELAAAGCVGAQLKETQAEVQALRQQVEDAVHKYNTAKQARERALSEVGVLHTLQPFDV